MATLTVENYVKAIYQLCGETESQSASTGEVARRLGVSPGTVTSMLRTLAESDLALYQAHRGARLSEGGRRLALRVLRRHRLIELFLVQTLGLAWDEVHEEAEHLEHALSDRLVDRIDAYLGFPERDPHGDPIPRPDGSVELVEFPPLLECPVGARVTLERVIDQSPEFLRYLTQAGLEIGAAATVVENQTEAGALVLEIADKRVPLGREVAANVLVRLSRAADSS